jgi:nitroimidazol reductase NimA-like FMN-containing flavoprotein (pyridoxamine 5'-phosphate oxidase superfamily)
MRRKEREITDRIALDEIVQKALVCRLAVCDGHQPYVIPLNFGYDGTSLYIHCAREGKKLDILKKNNRVCFEVDVDHELVKGETACDWSFKGKSVIAAGKAVLIEDAEGKRRAMDIIMEHYGARPPYSYKEKGFDKALIIKVDVENMTGKKLG